MIKILFVCHGSILRSSEKACKINGFMEGQGTYYTTTTPFFERALRRQRYQKNEFGNYMGIDNILCYNMNQVDVVCPIHIRRKIVEF